MGGGLMQLVAYGAQDIYLTGNPQITFFKVVYRRHTNFAVESIEQTFNGQADFGKRVTATISRNGDLIQQMYLEVTLPAVVLTGEVVGTPYWTYGVGNALVQQAEIEIGGQLIDRQYGDWMNIWTELSMPAGKRAGYDDMVGNATSDVDQVGGLVADGTAAKLFIPFQFWFNRNPGLALPLIALQYHEVKLNLDLRKLADLVNIVGPGSISGSPSISGNCRLWVDYIYLDTDERRRFAQVSHEYLIEQVQFTGDESIKSGDSSRNVTLNFNHPVKELVWVHVTTDHVNDNKWLNFGYGTTNTVTIDTLNPIIGADSATSVDAPQTIQQTIAPANDDTFSAAKLQLNGHDRFYQRDAAYFRKVQNLEHHTCVPRTPTVSAGGFGITATTTTLTASIVRTTTNTTPSLTYDDPRLSIFDNGAGDTQSLKLTGNTGGGQLDIKDGITPDVNSGTYTTFTSQARSSSATVVNSKATINANLCQYIYTYSFALSPEEHQPSGTCNFSRIDNAVLQLDYTGKTDSKNLKVFAVNYNVLRIMSGMGGLAYSN